MKKLINGILGPVSAKICSQSLSVLYWTAQNKLAHILIFPIYERIFKNAFVSGLTKKINELEQMLKIHFGKLNTNFH